MLKGLVATPSVSSVNAALDMENQSLIELLASWFERGPEIDADGARLLVRGVKLYSDGALGSRGAALIEDYSDEPQNLGLLRTSSDHIHDVCSRALATGFQVGIHAIGDRGNLVSLDGIERCFGGPRPAARFRIEHAQVMRLGDIERMAELGVIASMQPTHATSDMPWAEDRVGPARIRGAYAWRRVLEAGGRLALGSDFPVELADPTHGLYAAVTRQDHDGNPAGGWLPDQRLRRAEALRGFTLDAAHSLFLEEEVGSLELGKRADLTVFARDVMTVPAAEIPADTWIPIRLEIRNRQAHVYFNDGQRPALIIHDLQHDPQADVSKPGSRGDLSPVGRAHTGRHVGGGSTPDDVVMTAPCAFGVGLFLGGSPLDRLLLHEPRRCGGQHPYALEQPSIDVDRARPFDRAYRGDGRLRGVSLRGLGDNLVREEENTGGRGQGPQRFR